MAKPQVLGQLHSLTCTVYQHEVFRLFEKQPAGMFMEELDSLKGPILVLAILRFHLNVDIAPGSWKRLANVETKNQMSGWETGSS